MLCEIQSLSMPFKCDWKRVNMNIFRLKNRALLILTLLILLFSGIIYKLFLLQIVNRSWLEARAEKMWGETMKISPTRGSIVDRNGALLAGDTTAYTIAVNPKTIHEHKLEQDISAGLASILAANDNTLNKSALQNKIFNLITEKKKDSDEYMTEVEIRNEGWEIDGAIKDQLEQFTNDLKQKLGVKDVGVDFKASKMRYYPNNEFASHILGYMSKDGKAIGGIENKYNAILNGTPGLLKDQRDPHGIQPPDAQSTLVPAINGENVQLTIDKTIQYYLEDALKKGYDKWHPKSITAVAVDPQTMDILAMESMPTFNPNRYWEANDPNAFINQAVSSQYEPGSTFKLPTLAGAIEEGIFHPDELYESGSIHVPGNTLHDYNTGWGKISYMEGLLRSSNVAFVKLGYEGLKEDRFLKYVHNFGFGQSTGIDLPNEVPGVIRLKEPVEFATAAFGQGPLAVTTIQQTAAYAAIANGGKLMVPHVLKEIIEPQTGKVIKAIAPQFVRQVVSAKTANEVKNDLEQVVSNQKIGTGKNAYIPGYTVAGKTGTANIVKPGEKTYSTDTWLTSFIGFAPVDDPRILVSVIVDQPDLGGDFHKGSEVAPIIFKDIVSQSLDYLNVPKDNQTSGNQDKTDSALNVPSIEGLSVSDASSKLKQQGLQLQVFGRGEKILRQYPSANSEITNSETVYAATEDTIDETSMPSLKGKSLRDVMEICALLHLNYHVSGSGYVVSQSVTKTKDSNVLNIVCNPLN